MCDLLALNIKNLRARYVGDELLKLAESLLNATPGARLTIDVAGSSFKTRETFPNPGTEPVIYRDRNNGGRVWVFPFKGEVTCDLPDGCKRVQLEIQNASIFVCGMDGTKLITSPEYLGRNYLPADDVTFTSDANRLPRQRQGAAMHDAYGGMIKKLNASHPDAKGEVVFPGEIPGRGVREPITDKRSSGVANIPKFDTRHARTGRTSGGENVTEIPKIDVHQLRADAEGISRSEAKRKTYGEMFGALNDAPACDVCGTLTVRCPVAVMTEWKWHWKCLNCGNSTGGLGGSPVPAPKPPSTGPVLGEIARRLASLCRQVAAIETRLDEASIPAHPRPVAPKRLRDLKPGERCKVGNYTVRCEGDLGNWWYVNALNDLILGPEVEEALSQLPIVMITQ